MNSGAKSTPFVAFDDTLKIGNSMTPVVEYDGYIVNTDIFGGNYVKYGKNVKNFHFSIKQAYLLFISLIESYIALDRDCGCKTNISPKAAESSRFNS